MSTHPVTIGPYRVEAEIGRGGMGVVYRVHDGKLDRTVALKLLPLEFASRPELLARLEREARALAAISHPNVATIHGLEEYDGRRCLVLEFVEGESLAERLRRGPLSVDEALDVAAQVAHGLAAIHEADLVHRDLKPGNVMLAPDGRVRVLDLGLARTETGPGGTPGPDGTTATLEGVVLGTPASMSPEQARGEALDSRSDVWSLGVLLYECLVGHNPFQRTSTQETLACVLRDHADLDALPAVTPDPVRELLVRCMRRDRRRRLQSARDIALLLEEARALPAPVRSADRSETEAIREGRFPIDDELVRQLDRGGFDSSLVGWEMRYSDNLRPSENLLLWLPSFGGDHTTLSWRHLQSECAYRVVVATPVGMEPDGKMRPRISVENQFILLHAFAKWLRSRENPSRLMIGGFSCGADFSLRTAACAPPGLFDALISVDPNLERETCFLSGMFAELDPERSEDVLGVLKRCYEQCRSVEEWLMLSGHLLACVDKLKDDFGALVGQARDISDPFRPGAADEDSPFADWYREANDRVRVQRHIFADNHGNRRVLGALRLRHLEDGCLGERFDEASVRFTSESGHMEMSHTGNLLRVIDDAVEALGGGWTGS